MLESTNWVRLEQTALQFLNSRWPYVGKGILDLLPLLKSEEAFEQAWIFTSLGTLVLLFPSGSIRKFHVIANESGLYEVYWYEPNDTDEEKEPIRLTVSLIEVVPTVLGKITG